jgi:lycopene beta-cyclase
VGLEFRFDVPHGLDCPVIMDATVDQAAGYRFVYCLPFDRHRMLVEDTYYSLDPRLDVPVLRARIERYVGERGWSPAEVLREERGVLPVALAGDVDATWRATPVPAIGLRGGFFHPTTGYSLPDALRIAERIAREPRLTSAGLHGVLAQEARRLWRERRFYRLLNRMLFHAAPPAERFRIFQHFFRLDPALIARFYAAQTSLGDKARILSGRPPCGIAPAIAAILRVGSDVKRHAA